MNCESLSDWGRGALSCSPPVNLCPESGPLQIKLFDPAPLALPSAPVHRCRVREQLWPIDRGSCGAHTSRCRRISIWFISEFWGRKKKKKSFSCGNKNMSTLIHVKKRLYPCPWRACVSVRQLMCVSVSVCVMSCLNCLLCWYFTIDLMTKAEHYTLSVE